MKVSPRHRHIQIAHLTPQLDVGGLERLLVELAKRIDRSRFQLQFVSLGKRGALADEIEKEGWPVRALGMPPGLRPRAVLRLARYLRSGRIDVLHTHNDRALLYGAPAAKLAGVRRIIHTRHGQSYNRSVRQQLAFQSACRWVQFVVAVSADVSRISSREGIAADKNVTVANAIDTVKFRYAGPRTDGPLMMVGRLSEEKNVGMLLHALRIAAAREPELRLKIVGDGPCRDSLQRTARQLGVDRRVSFLGESRSVENLLRESSLFVLPSLTEGTSLTLLEAMAVGLPIVATDVGGNSEVVLDGVTGLLAPSNDPDAMAQAIVQLWADPARRRQMGLAARRRVVEHYDLGSFVGSYQDLYQGIRPADAPQADACSAC